MPINWFRAELGLSVFNVCEENREKLDLPPQPRIWFWRNRSLTLVCNLFYSDFRGNKGPTSPSSCIKRHPIMHACKKRGVLGKAAMLGEKKWAKMQLFSVILHCALLLPTLFLSVCHFTLLSRCYDWFPKTFSVVLNRKKTSPLYFLLKAAIPWLYY